MKVKDDNELLVSDEDINEAFEYASFGIAHKDVVKYGLLKSACGYKHGHTSTLIIIELGLITEKRRLTRKGRVNLYEWFKDESKSP